jgi:hypothetical protein
LGLSFNDAMRRITGTSISQIYQKRKMRLETIGAGR